MVMSTLTLVISPDSSRCFYRSQVKVLGPNTGGVLGLEFLNRYDLDLNFETNEARFYVAGAVDQGLIGTSGLEELVCGYLPGGKLGIKMELNGRVEYMCSRLGNQYMSADIDTFLSRETSHFHYFFWKTHLTFAF